MVDRRKKLFNLHEEASNIHLSKNAKQFGAKVVPKMRIADVLNIKSSGLSNEEYRYALQAHFDFILYDDENNPLFAVEFDGPLHENDMITIKKDILKNTICEKLEFPLLRINADFLTKKIKNFSILSWIIEVWFFGQEFFKQQEQGLIPIDEIFDYSFIMKPFLKDGILDVDFPYFLSANAIILINKCRAQGTISRVIFKAYEDKMGFTYGIIIASIDERKGIMSKVRVKSFNFYPPSPSDIVEELAVIDIANKIKTFLNNKEKCIDSKPIFDFLNKIQFNSKDVTFLRGFSI